jgi:hypothetical protein
MYDIATLRISGFRDRCPSSCTQLKDTLSTHICINEDEVVAPPYVHRPREAVATDQQIGEWAEEVQLAEVGESPIEGIASDFELFELSHGANARRQSGGAERVTETLTERVTETVHGSDET